MLVVELVRQSNIMFPKYSKHLIECACSLPQYQSLDRMIYHKFVVFSVMDDKGIVNPKLVMCNTCDRIHKVVDICKSEILSDGSGRFGIRSIDDVKSGLPTGLIKVVDKNELSLATWEEIEYKFKNQDPSPTVLGKEQVKGDVFGKYLEIKNPNDFYVGDFHRNDAIGG